MIFLLDTNVWLEMMLNQERADEAHGFVTAVPLDELALTDFCLFSIAIRLHRLSRLDALRAWMDDVLQGGAHVLRLEHGALAEVIEVINEECLDFDDAYQYTAAQRFNLQLVSVDADFDKTARGRLTPAQAHVRFTEEQ